MVTASRTKLSSLFSATPTTPGDGLVTTSLPYLISLSALGRRLTVPQKKVRAQQAGQRLSRLKGRGMEFDEVRPYIPGDDVRCLDWRVTARTGKAHTKLFREERDRPILVSVDNRSTMYFASRGVFKSVQAAKLAAILAWMGNREGDKVGGQLFSEYALHDYQPQKGRHSVLRWLNALAEQTIPPWIKQQGPADQQADAKEQSAQQGSAESEPFLHALKRLAQHGRPGSMVFLISDFRGWNNATRIQVSRLARHCDVICVFIYDALEVSLPENGRFRFTDGQRETVVDTRSHAMIEQYADNFAQRKQRVEKFCRANSMRFLSCATTDNPLTILMAGLAK